VPALPDLAITGSTGAIGGKVAVRLAAKGVEQRLVVRDASAAPVLDGATPVEAAGYGDSEGMSVALTGATTLFLVSGRESVDRLQQHLSAVDAAREAGVERIVYLSFLGAAPDATFTLARQHHTTEQHIRESVPRFTFMRSGLYADFVPYFAGAEGVIRGPAGDGAVSWICRDDIADAVVAVLTGSGHDGAVYEDAGPEALTLAETAAVLSHVTGRSVAYQDETIDEAWASRRPSGAPDWEIEGWVTSYLAIATGEMATVSTDVDKLIGRPPQRLRAFLEANPALWAHLVETTGT
jgi:NAD(P)H dehydrogenase (quinone)